MEQIKEKEHLTKEKENKTENMDNKTEIRKQKLKFWLSNKYNFIFLGVLIFAVVLRIYYFSKVGNQPFWWDEAEYMRIAQRWAFEHEFNFNPVRPILLSLIYALFLKISNSEFLPRVFMFLLSFASVIGVYYLGKEIYDKKIAILASLFMSVFYLNLFLTYRLLVDLPSLVFFTFSAFLFYKYIKTDSKKMLYLTAGVLAIGTLFRLTTAAFLFVILVYLLITQRLSFLKKKEIWIAALIYLLFLMPYFIWGFFEFHGFVITQAAELNPPTSISQAFGLLKGYIVRFPGYLTWAFLIIFILSLLSLYKVFLGFDMLHKKENSNLKRDLYLLLLFLIPLIMISFLINSQEDRYIITIFPAVFLLSSSLIFSVYDKIKTKQKYIALVFLILLVGFICFSQLKMANSLIISKSTSYLEVKQAAQWLKENSNESATILTKSMHQVIVYSDREKVYDIPSTKEEFEKKIKELNPDFLMLSVFESHPEWAYAYPQENPDKLEAVKAYSSGDKPLLVVYRFKK